MHVPPTPAVSWYDAHSLEQTAQYESLRPEIVQSWLLEHLPKLPALVIDIGAGSGRDAAWMADLGYDVIAVEPSANMRARAILGHPSPRIRWVDGSLPSLSGLNAGEGADLVLVSAVWMHIPPAERPAAFATLVGLLKRNGLLALSLRLGPADPVRAMHPAAVQEVLELASAYTLDVIVQDSSLDQLGRTDITWGYVGLRRREASPLTRAQRIRLTSDG